MTEPAVPAAPDPTHLSRDRVGVTVDLAVLRLLLAAAGLGAWATSGLLPLAATPTLASAGIVAATALSVATLVARPQTWVPAAFLLAVIATRLTASAAPTTPADLLIAMGFVASLAACHSLAALCAITGADGRVAARALLPTARRLIAITVVAATALAAGAGTSVTAPVGTALVVLATIALVAALAMVARSSRG